MTAPYREIVVGSDGSATATCAVRSAAALARAVGAPLCIVTGWYRELPDGPVPSEESSYPGGSASSNEAAWATDTTSDAAAIARAAGVAEVSQHQPIGNPADQLLQFADERSGSLVVVGTVGLGSRADRMVGNVPHQLTHHSTRDVFLVARTGCEDDVSWSRIGLATDGSPTAALACERGLALARALGVKPTLLTVAKDEAKGDAALEHTADQLGDVAGSDRRVVVARKAAEGLVEAADDLDLLVLGNKGMSGPSRLLGSVADRVTHAVPTDLLLINTTR